MELSESFLQTPLAQLSVKDFVSLLKEYQGSYKTSSEQLFDEESWVSGYKNLAKYLHCSVPTVCRLVKSGKIDPAIRRIGATCWFDKNKIRDLMKVWDMKKFFKSINLVEWLQIRKKRNYQFQTTKCRINSWQQFSDTMSLLAIVAGVITIITKRINKKSELEI